MIFPGACPLIVAPTVEPVSLAEAKAHLRVDVGFTSEDGLIGSLITTAREICEGRTWRAFIEQTRKLFLDAWPDNEIIEIPYPPLLSIESITYFDENGTSQTMAASDYQVDIYSTPGRVTPAFDTTWPDLYDVPHAVAIEFKAGYGDDADAVPAKIKQAILLLVGHWYANREEVITGTIVNQMPFAAEMILQSIAVS